MDFETITVTDTSLDVQYSMDIVDPRNITAVHLVVSSLTTISRYFFDHNNGHLPEQKGNKYKGSITGEWGQ